jgi:hypothetical protein
MRSYLTDMDVVGAMVRESYRRAELPAREAVGAFVERRFRMRGRTRGTAKET